MKEFLSALQQQRLDDHRYYHHSRINQSLHLLSALSFLGAYALLWINPVVAAMIGWGVAMVSRQAGHFFFEPKGYDTVNQVTHEYKEEVKVGYNLRRKVVLMGIWGASPLLLLLEPGQFGLPRWLTAEGRGLEALGMVWLGIGVAGLLFRTIHLFFLRDLQTGLVWLIKILTDPFNDVRLYYKAPLHLARGEWLDPMMPKTHA